MFLMISRVEELRPALESIVNRVLWGTDPNASWRSSQMIDTFFLLRLACCSTD